MHETFARNVLQWIARLLKVVKRGGRLSYSAIKVASVCVVDHAAGRRSEGGYARRVVASSLVSICTMRMSSTRASRQCPMVVIPLESSTSTIAAHSIALPRAMAMKCALSAGALLPTDSAMLSEIDRAARVS